MNAATEPPRDCAFCGQPIDRDGRVGRPRDYCKIACRRSAQRERDRRAASAKPRARGQAGPIAADVELLAKQLAGQQLREVSLGARIRTAQTLEEILRCYVPAAVQDSRATGASWDEIAEAADVSRASACARWGPTKTQRLLKARPNILP